MVVAVNLKDVSSRMVERDIRERAEPMGALPQRSSLPFVGDGDPEFRGALRKSLQPGNPIFDIWLYVWAVRKTGSVLGPVHDLTHPRAKVLAFPSRR